MSSALYAIGRWAIRAKHLVVWSWVALLVVLAGTAGLFGQGANGSVSIPGTESQAAIDTLSHTFPEAGGTSATIIVVANDGDQVDSATYREAIERLTDPIADAPRVTAVQTPFSDTGATDVSDDGQAALVTVQIEGEMDSVPDATDTAIKTATRALGETLPNGSQVSYGGEMYSASIPGVTATEAIGVLIALIVLFLTLGSLIAAGLPLLTALLGVGVSIAGVFSITAFVELTSTTPMLALMLGLAVGIDYTLFIVSRHQEQLRSGVETNESIARATATSGSAVVFAGLTVIIALVGLSVAGIPFLTALGVAAAAAVAIAVLIAVTATPALLALAGARILPKKQRALINHGDRAEAAVAAASHTAPETAQATHGATGNTSAGPDDHQPSRASRFFGGWVRGVTKRPIITILAVLIGLGIAAIPAFDLRLALPNAASLEKDNPARVTYELTGEHFGEGFNGPLLLTGSIITSEDPLGLMDDLADEVRKVPGVADVPLSTPNQGADTGIIQVIPEEGPDAISTSDLVHKLRAMHDTWEDKYGVSLAVTGFTAVGIDVSHMLLVALVPFGILVVGLSLILLAMVFRSVWVPLKATLGYALSVGAAFGAVVAVFQWGWFADLLNVHHSGPVLAFMPIILMGVLFGLAMDYEVFLVSRIREEYVHGSDAKTAIHRGFIGSGPVVTAAAIIMFAVFAAFVPEGDPSIKVIALGLAIGVFVDAFVVRMTLVPAVLALLGDRAWSMPRWLGKLLPHFDVEGEGLARELEYASWPPDMPDAAIAGDDLQLPGHIRVDRLRVPPGGTLVLDPRDPQSVRIAEVVTGRGALLTGTLKVDGLLLPERAPSIRSRTAWATPATLRDAVRDQPSVLVLDLRGMGEAPVKLEDLEAMRSALASLAVEAERRDAPKPTTLVLGDSDLAARLTPHAATELTPTTPLVSEGAHR